MATLKKYIDFPIEEHKGLLKRIHKNQIIYTTRVSNEINKYFINSIYDSSFGKLKVVYFKHFTDLKEHPFLNELSEKQIAEITKYVSESGFDLIGLIRI